MFCTFRFLVMIKMEFELCRWFWILAEFIKIKLDKYIFNDFYILILIYYRIIILWYLEFWPWWSTAIAVICPLFASEKEILDAQNKKVATIFDVSTPEELERLRPEDEQAENLVVNLLDWQVYFRLLCESFRVVSSMKKCLI